MRRKWGEGSCEIVRKNNDIYEKDTFETKIWYYFIGNDL